LIVELSRNFQMLFLETQLELLSYLGSQQFGNGDFGLAVGALDNGVCHVFT
jgi:hypothetical protein